jgi:hypothetical protein
MLTQETKLRKKKEPANSYGSGQPGRMHVRVRISFPFFSCVGPIATSSSSSSNQIDNARTSTYFSVSGVSSFLDSWRFKPPFDEPFAPT